MTASRLAIDIHASRMPILHRLRMIFFVKFGMSSRWVLKSCQQQAVGFS